ncbi:MAG: MFS transporter [Ignavibacteriae bacterium]|nr:MFS transporter [Ignavibacteriota bacterium]
MNWKKNLYILWGTQFLVMVAMNLIVPFLPFFIRELGVSDDNDVARWTGMIFAGPFLTAFIATPFWTTMGDKHGKKLMVLRAIFGLGIAHILIGFSQNVYQLLLFRILQGIISGFIAATLALVSTSTPKEKIGYALGILQSATAGGTVFGPALGGVLADMIGYREIFFIVAGMCFISGFVVVKFVEEVPVIRQDGTTISVFQNLQFMMSHKQLRIIALSIILSQGAAMMIEPIFALYIEGIIRRTAIDNTAISYISTLTGITFSIAGIFMVLSSPWWGRRNDRIGFKRNLIPAFIGTGIAYGLHIIIPNLFALGFLRAVLGFVRGGILHTLFSLTSVHAPHHRRSGLIGITSSLAVFGNMIGPLTGGFVAGHFSIPSVFVVNSAIFIITSVMLWKYLIEPPKSYDENLQDMVNLQKSSTSDQ